MIPDDSYDAKLADLIKYLVFRGDLFRDDDDELGVLALFMASSKDTRRALLVLDAMRPSVPSEPSAKPSAEDQRELAAVFNRRKAEVACGKHPKLNSDIIRAARKVARQVVAGECSDSGLIADIESVQREAMAINAKVAAALAGVTDAWVGEEAKST